MMAAVMKLVLVGSLAICAAATLQFGGHRKLAGQSPKELSLAVGDEAVFYGDTRCPCIGFDNIEGETTMQIPVNERKSVTGKRIPIRIEGESIEVSYPADLASRCEAWDDERHPKCKKGQTPGSGEGWCAQEWCYVDPCNCDIDVLPTKSLFNTEATFRGMPLFWSYATCGGEDMFTEKKPVLGGRKCRCIGFAGVSGTTEINFKDGKMAEYPADLGSSCSTWDRNVHPECQGDKVPSWCKSNWCYVDPCNCDLPGDTVPKISAYLPKATFTGKNVYYSYETCGSADTWTEDNHLDACVNQATKGDCGNLPRCSWTGSRCLGSELVHHPLCKAAAKKLFRGKEDSGSAQHKTSLVLMAVVAVTSAAAACA